MPENYSFGVIALLPLEKHLELIREIKPIAEKEDVRVLGSYGMQPVDGIEGFVKAAKAIEDAGADLFKFAVAGCPLVEATKSEEERQADLKLYYEADIGAGLAALEAKADALEVKADDIQATVTATNNIVAALPGSIGTIQTMVGALEAKADALEAKADRLEGKVDALVGDIGTIVDRHD